MSKPYHFSLQKVLDVRKHTENQRAIELNRAQQKLKTEQEKLEQLNQSKEKVLDKDTYKAGNAVDISLNELRVTTHYIEQLNNEITNQKTKVKKTDQEVEKNRGELVSAVKDKKMVEILKDKYSMKYKKMQNLEESKNESEIALRIAMNSKDR